MNENDNVTYMQYSTSMQVLLASQIALHDPHMRQQKGLPLVLSLNIGAVQFGIDCISEPKTLGIRKQSLCFEQKVLVL